MNFPRASVALFGFVCGFGAGAVGILFVEQIYSGAWLAASLLVAGVLIYLAWDWMTSKVFERMVRGTSDQQRQAETPNNALFYRLAAVGFLGAILITQFWPSQQIQGGF